MRAAQVRNSNMIADEDEIGVIDAVEWEEIKRKGVQAIKDWILSQLHLTSVTVVLIGAETAYRDWVLYEITESWNRGNAVVGVRIHNVKDPRHGTDVAGMNPFERLRFADGTPLSAYCSVYDWIQDDGRKNLGTWADTAVVERANHDSQGKLPYFEPAPSGTSSVKDHSSSTPTPQTKVISNPPGQWAQ